MTAALPVHVIHARAMARRRLSDAMVRYWSLRPCFICGGYGYRWHREPEIAQAEAERLRRAKREARRAG